MTLDAEKIQPVIENNLIFYKKTYTICASPLQSHVNCVIGQKSNVS